MQSKSATKTVDTDWGEISLVIRCFKPEKPEISPLATIKDHPWALPPIRFENTFRTSRNMARTAIGQGR
ncbi:hypothetical protein PCAR4_450096 [Paraburkholderia caribensis]|nr:hypothetical protein PCAR4_450096 [Paraburkholderia caribensis]